MAFPIPSHLPRKPTETDVSTKILTKIDDATYKSLNATLASTWVAELDEAIRSTKKSIHERIHSQLPEFERQFSSAKSLQTRAAALKADVNNLCEAVSSPETGLIPRLVQALAEHAALAQRCRDASVEHDLLEQLMRYHSDFNALVSFLEEGRLPQAMSAYLNLETLMSNAPSALTQSHVFAELKDRLRTLRDRTEEQLSEAYSRSIVISASHITLRSSVQVRQSNTTLSLSSILSSFPSASLNSHLATFRRDLTTHYIHRILQQPTSITANLEHTSLEGQEYKFSLFPSPPEGENRVTRLDNLSALLIFLSSHLFGSLPESQSESFPRSLTKAITSALLQNLLIPSLPSSFEHLPAYLSLVKATTDFETKFVVGLLGSPDTETEVNNWAQGIGGHYERKRRIQILDGARAAIVAPEKDGVIFRAEVVIDAKDNNPDRSAQVACAGDEIDEDGWGFQEDNGREEHTAPSQEEDSWGFDENMDVDVDAGTEPLRNDHDVNASQGYPSAPQEDPADAWGWNDDAEPTLQSAEDEEAAWDDPWSDPPTESRVKEASSSSPYAATAPKPATRLEKYSTNSKKAHTNGTTPKNPSALSMQSPRQDTPVVPRAEPSANGLKLSSRPLSKQAHVVETYAVSERIRTLLRMTEDVLTESMHYSSSKLFSNSSPSSASHGTLLFQAGLSILDLYRAMYPVVFSSDLAASSAMAMRFSNDCSYASGELSRLTNTISQTTGIQDRIVESIQRLKLLGESWFADITAKQQEVIMDALDGAEGFTGTGDQERFDECESIVSRVLRDVRSVAHQWKNVLTKSRYYTAVGLVVDAALSKILTDILALPDIPEVESHRLSELCRIMHALEHLFVEPPREDSFVVVYVPSWLKYSYLSELLEASIADISYLFGEGALVDFDIDELVRLVKALFADTPLRAKTIDKLRSGHPVQSS